MFSHAIQKTRFHNNAGKPGVSIVPADGLVINGYHYGAGEPYTLDQYRNSLKADPFPGTEGVDHLNATMELPNYKFYHGEETPKQSLRNITENDGVVSFYFNDGTPSGIVDVRSNMEVDRGNYYDLQGRRIVQPSIYRERQESCHLISDGLTIQLIRSQISCS